MSSRLDSLPRAELIEKARGLGAPRPELMTRGELAAEIARLEQAPARLKALSWFGIARDLVASLVEQGLNLPDAAALIRGDTRLSEPPRPPPPVATVTLAQIYAAQGHTDKALRTLREVLKKEPDHETAAKLLKELEEKHGEPKGATTTQAPLAEAPIPREPLVESTAPLENAGVAAVAAEEITQEQLLTAVAEPTRASPRGPLLLLFTRDKRHYQLYWELSAQTRQRLAERLGAGRPVVKLLFLHSIGTQIERREQRLELDVSDVSRGGGSLEVQSTDSNAIVRGALGWSTADDVFHAAAVGAIFSIERGDPVALWKPYARFQADAALERALRVMPAALS